MLVAFRDVKCLEMTPELWIIRPWKNGWQHKWMIFASTRHAVIQMAWCPGVSEAGYFLKASNLVRGVELWRVVWYSDLRVLAVADRFSTPMVGMHVQVSL